MIGTYQAPKIELILCLREKAKMGSFGWHLERENSYNGKEKNLLHSTQYKRENPNQTKGKERKKHPFKGQKKREIIIFE